MALILLSLLITVTLGFSGLFTETLLLFFNLPPTRLSALAINIVALIMGFVFIYTLYHARFKKELPTTNLRVFKFKAASFSALICLAVALISAVITACYFITIAQQSPFGGWDAIAIYNTKARFIAHSSLPFEAFFARDYNIRYDCPLLLSSIIANLWVIFKSDTYIVPIIINGLYLFSLAIFVAGLLSLHHHRIISLLGFLAIISCNKLIYYSAIQYADIPISCYFTQALGVLYLAATTKNSPRPFFVFIALLTGFCAATKNDGLAMTVVNTLAVLSFSFSIARKYHVGNFIKLAKNAAPNIALYCIVWFITFLPTLHLKKMAGVTNHMFAGNSTSLLIEKITSLYRYEIIIEHLGLYLPQVGGVLSLVLLLLLTNSYRKQSELHWIKTILLLAIGSLLVIYLMVFLFTQIEIVNHTRSAMDRLLVQLWPLFVSGALIGIFENKKPT